MFTFKSKETRKKEERIATIKSLMSKNKTIETLMAKGLLSYDVSKRRWFIASVLAEFYLNNSERWSAFLNNIYNWVIYKEREEAWKNYFLNIEIKAVREAKKKYPVLSKAEIQSIRQKARMSVDVNEVEMDKLEGFEFFITDLTSPQEPIISVGQYDGENFHMAIYDDIKRFLEKN